MEYSEDTNSTPINLNDRQQQHPANSNNVSGNSNIFDTSSTNTNSQQSMMSSSRMSQSYGGLDNSSSFLLRQGILPPSTSQLHR